MYYRNGNFEIYYEKYGDSKETILILPGWGFTRPTFYPLINSLMNNYTIYIIDYPGFGKSSFKEFDLTIYDYASAIRELMLELKIEEPIIIAHSFGGRITTLLAGYYKDKIRKLILIDTAGIKPKTTLKKLIRRYSYKFLKKVANLLPKRKRKKVKNYLLKKYSSPDYYDLPDNVKKTFQNIVNEDLTKYLKEIKTETLIIWGQKDTSTPLKDAYKMNKEIKDSGLIVFKGASHYAYLDYPYLTLNIIESFLK